MKKHMIFKLALVTILFFGAKANPEHLFNLQVWCIVLVLTIYAMPLIAKTLKYLNKE